MTMRHVPPFPLQASRMHIVAFVAQTARENMFEPAPVDSISGVSRPQSFRAVCLNIAPVLAEGKVQSPCFSSAVVRYGGSTTVDASCLQQVRHGSLEWCEIRWSMQKVMLFQGPAGAACLHNTTPERIGHRSVVLSLGGRISRHSSAVNSHRFGFAPQAGLTHCRVGGLQ